MQPQGNSRLAAVSLQHSDVGLQNCKRIRQLIVRRNDICSVCNNSPVHFFEPLFWIGQLLDTLRLKARAIFDGSNFNADPHEL